MRLMKVMPWCAAALLTTAGLAHAQSTTGTISGRVVDAQTLPMPGVTISAESPNLQGIRTVVTSDYGDYIITLLPPGQYRVTFELGGFQRQERAVNLAPTQVLPLEVTMGPAALSESVEVVGQSANVLLRTAQVATNFSQELLSTLPTTRDVRAVMYLAPTVHASGPFGFFSVGGAMSFENLYMVNGVTINENLAGQPLLLTVEDAVQETTVATAGISAEYGRFGGGVVNVVTKSGGNLFGGSFRETLTNDNWRALVPKRDGDPFANDSKLHKTIPTHEYTLGGPIVKDRLWFFTAGMLQSQQANRQLVITNTPYVFQDKTRRFEGKLTYSLDANHRFQGAYTKVSRELLNNTNFQVMDLASLEDRREPGDLFTVNYNGILSPSFFLEARYSQRDQGFEGSGSKFTDRINGTLLVDPTGRRYWSATFCAVCPPEERNNKDIFVKGSYFLSTSRFGSQNMTFGYDNFDDIRFVANHQSGSDFRVTNATAIVSGTDIFPMFRSGTSVIQWNPIFLESRGTDFRTHSVFFNDNWQLSTRLTASLGVRWDKNDGVNSNGDVVANGSSFSPRLGVVWDPKGEGRWSLTGSAAKYVAGLSNRIADLSSPAGQQDTYRFVYRGPDINVNPNGPRVPTPEALAQLFAWYDANGGETLPLNGPPTVKGVSPQIRGSLDSPNSWEYAGGVNRQLGNRGALRADVVYRTYQDFYVARADPTTGVVTDDRSFAPPSVFGRQYDLTLIENDTQGLLKRQYAGLTLQGHYRVGSRIDAGANYTLSRLWGNIDGESAVLSGVSTDSAMPYQYPEYRQASWNYPDGNLAGDQRHRARLWLNYGVPRVEGLTLSLLQALESGVPYSPPSFNGVDPSRYVTNPGYLTPPAGDQTQYYFQGRDQFRTEGLRRTDLATNYTHRVGRGGRNVGLFVQAQVINLFNQFQRCGCGGSSLFPLGGNITTNNIDSTIRTNVTNPTLYSSFDPFTTAPVEGVNWAMGPNFGKALNRFAYTTPRTFRITFGVRF
jgi:hypothetical protein